MIDIIKGEMGVSSQRIPVARYEVWWMTPAGLFGKDDLALAIRKVEEMDLIPSLNIAPVSVAIAATGEYEVIGR